MNELEALLKDKEDEFKTLKTSTNKEKAILIQKSEFLEV